MAKDSLEQARALFDDALLSGWEVSRTESTHLFATRDGVTIGLAWPELWTEQDRWDEVSAASTDVSWVLCGAPEQLLRDEHPVTAGMLPMPASPEMLASTLSFVIHQQGRVRELEARVERLEYENRLWSDIGRALGRERDLELLLDLILTKARAITNADAGSIYVVEGVETDARRLRFVESQNDSRNLPTAQFEMPVSSASIVGACVLRAEVLNIADLYALDVPGKGNNPWGFVHDRSLDRTYEYQTRSMLTIPLISARAQVIGVVQLINRRRHGTRRLDTDRDFAERILPFDDDSVMTAKAFASQAGLALENALLYQEVRTLFEGFVRASVSAIEARDPTTSGHSVRVADLTVGLAKAADRCDVGAMEHVVFTADQLREIEYAALLHDFGKVGVREHVLVKAAKLYEHQRNLIESRFEYIRRSLEVEHLSSKVKYLLDKDRDQTAEALADVDKEAADRLKEIDDFLLLILNANQPTILEEDSVDRLAEIASRTYLDRQGLLQPYLHPEEVRALRIARGSLTEEERREIESHVVHTEQFLRRIPWGHAFRGVPSIAAAHHEKLDGTGYPRGLTSESIPLPAKMMTITDIYDALTAADRPYKKAVPAERALDILRSEVERGKVDGNLFQLFVDAKVYKVVS